MKETALEKSATKPLIYGTYAMASEGMNIPALDTLILASPKSDIVQSCGRILRTRPEDRINVPLVIDVVDRFPSLERQYNKRKEFYKEYKYEVEGCEWDPTKCELVVLTSGGGSKARSGDRRGKNQNQLIFTKEEDIVPLDECI